MLGAAVGGAAPVKVQLQEAVSAVESAAANGRFFAGLRLQLGLQAVTVVFQLDEPRVQLVVCELQRFVKYLVKRFGQVDRRLTEARLTNAFPKLRPRVSGIGPSIGSFLALFLRFIPG